MPSAALVLATLALAAGDPDWLVVRGDAELVRPMSYERLVDVYLKGHEARIVPATEGEEHPAASRMVVGTPRDHALVADVAAGFGLVFDGDVARFRGSDYALGTGFVLCARDPDGGGLLTLVTGADAESLLACFTVTHDLTQPGYAIVQRGKKLATGPLLSGVDLSRPLVVRLDCDVDRLLEETEGWPPGDRELRVARGVAGFGHVYQALVGRSDTLPSVQALLADTRGLGRDARRAWGRKDLVNQVERAYARCREALGDPEDVSAPIVYVVNDPSAATNGKTFDPDPLTGRPQVVLNLAPLTRDGNLEAVCVHELLHTLQGPGGSRAVDRGMREGSATLGTQLVDPSVGDAAALLWSDVELAAAEERRDELVAAFLRDAGSDDRDVQHAWFTLGAELDAVPGAPSRSGYYVCWLACKAWLAEHPRAGLAGLFAAPADEVLAALE